MGEGPIHDVIVAFVIFFIEDIKRPNAYTQICLPHVCLNWSVAQLLGVF